MRTVTEYHGGPKCLTRVRLQYNRRGHDRLAQYFHPVGARYRQVFLGNDDLYAWLLYGLLVLWLGVASPAAEAPCRRSRARRRGPCGLIRVFGEASKPAPGA